MKKHYDIISAATTMRHKVCVLCRDLKVDITSQYTTHNISHRVGTCVRVEVLFSHTILIKLHAYHLISHFM